MSKYMQLKVSVRPYYTDDLEDAYPRLARHLSYTDPGLAAKNPSLYEIAGQLDMLLYRSEGTRLREGLLPRRERLLALYRNIQKHIADWNLAAADRLLYEMEDVFGEVETEL